MILGEKSLSFVDSIKIHPTQIIALSCLSTVVAAEADAKENKSEEAVMATEEEGYFRDFILKSV